MAGLFAITEDLTGNQDTTLVERGKRALTLAASAGAVRLSAASQGESLRQQGVDRSREGFPDRHSRPPIHPSCENLHFYLTTKVKAALQGSISGPTTARQYLRDVESALV